MEGKGGRVKEGGEGERKEGTSCVKPRVFWRISRDNAHGSLSLGTMKSPTKKTENIAVLSRANIPCAKLNMGKI